MRPGSLLLLLSDLLEVGTACMDQWLDLSAPRSIIRQDQGKFLAPALKHSYAGRQTWPVEEHRARLCGARGQAVEELDASCRAAGNCR